MIAIALSAARSWGADDSALLMLAVALAPLILFMTRLDQ
jgi:hypothetical protein